MDVNEHLIYKRIHFALQGIPSACTLFDQLFNIVLLYRIILFIILSNKAWLYIVLCVINSPLISIFYRDNSQ